MRGNTTGVPKVVMVITDGDSDNNKLTIGNATAIKERDFSIITVGIGNLFTNEKELIEMASSRNDAYKIDDYDKIATFLSSLSKSSNQKSAVVPRNLQIETQVSENSYKYLTVNTSSISSRKIYIKLVNEANSRTDFYYSFDDPNPKSDSDYINENEPSNKKLIRNSYIGKNVIEIDVPDNKKELYISVKGMNNLNMFDLIVSETPFVDETTTTPLTPPSSTKTTPLTSPTSTTTPPSSTTTTGGSTSTSSPSSLDSSSTSNSIGTTTTPPITTSTPNPAASTTKKNNANKNTDFFVFLFLLIPIFNFFLE